MKYRKILSLAVLLFAFNAFAEDSIDTLIEENIDNIELDGGSNGNTDVIIYNNGNAETIEVSIDNTNKMNLREILEFTFENNDELNAERAKTKAVKTLKFKTIGQNALPNIGADLNYGYTDFKQNFSILKLEDDGTMMNNKLYLQQPIFKSGRTITQVKAANSRIQMQLNTLNQKEQEILFDAIQATVNLLQAKEIYDITVKNEESLKSSYEYVSAIKKVGRATSSDVSLAQARYSSAKSDTIMAGTQYLNAKTNFLKITKIDPNSIDVSYDAIFKKGFDYSISFDTVLEMALQKNPQYQIAKSNYEMNRNNLNFTRTSFLPEIYLNAQISKQDTTDVISQRDMSVSLNLRVPIFQSGVEYASNREASHLLNEAKFTLNDVKESLMKQSMTTYDEFLSSKSLIVSSRAYRDAARLALDSTIAEERVGKSTIVDVLDRRREYFNTEINFLKNKTNVITYYYALRLLMGELNLVDLFV